MQNLQPKGVTQAILHPFTVLIIINYCGGRSAEKTVHYIGVLKVHKLKIVRVETNLSNSYCERRKSLNFFLNTLIELLFFISGGVSFQTFTAAYFAPNWP